MNDQSADLEQQKDLLFNRLHDAPLGRINTAIGRSAMRHHDRRLAILRIEHDLDLALANAVNKMADLNIMQEIFNADLD